MQARFTRYLLALCLSIIIGYTANAQNAARIYVEPNGWSIGMNVGLSDLWGDVGTRSLLDHYTNSKYFDKVAFMGGMFGRYTIHPAFAVRLQLNYGTLYATDKWNYDKAVNSPSTGDDAFQRYIREQNAKTIMVEGTVLLELMPFRWNPESKWAHKRGQPFIGAGFSYFHFTPYSTVAGGPRYVQTYNLDLEGQGWGAGFPPKYSLWQPGIPLAIGYRWDLGQHLNLGIEYMYRFTFTDYLDGVSGKYVSAAQFAAHLSPANAALAEQVADKSSYFNNELPNIPGTNRGNSGNNDSYSTISVTLSFKVPTRTREWWH